jgi:hypothetical protein
MPLQAYVKYLAAHGVNVEDVVTEMRFDIDSATPKLFFSPVRPLEEHEHNICSLKAQTPEAKTAITMTVAQTDGVQGKAKAALPKPTPKVEAQDEEESAPPTKKPAKKQEEVKATKSASELLTEWDDDN